MAKLIYEQLPAFGDDGWTREDIEATMARGDPQELLYVPIVITMDPPDGNWAAELCIRLAAHPHWNVRGNAILGLGHLARTCGQLDESIVGPIIVAGLEDPHTWVRGQAGVAADDVMQ